MYKTVVLFIVEIDFSPLLVVLLYIYIYIFMDFFIGVFLKPNFMFIPPLLLFYLIVH